MTSPSAAEGAGLVDALGELPHDPSGSRTFERYRWQCKQALLRWLECLSGDPDPPVMVVCEHVEDVVVVHESRLRFAQLKTRDRGSWSDSGVCAEGKGLDSLVRSYLAARAVGLHSVSSFELWLEGPMAENRQTAEFFADPSTARKDVQDRLVSLGLPRRQVSDFLGRLSIRVRQPSREHMDAVVLQLMGAIWRRLTRSELESLYGRLLARAEAAQEHTAPRVVETYRATRGRTDHASVVEQFDLAPLEGRCLTADDLKAITPALPSESLDDLIARVARGEAPSALELKMRTAGISPDQIAAGQALRAEAEVVRQRAVAENQRSTEDFERLAIRLLAIANAHARQAMLLAGSNPSVADRPGEYVYNELVARPSELASADVGGMLDRDGQLVLGYLCQLSDECRFGWRSYD